MQQQPRTPITLLLLGFSRLPASAMRSGSLIKLLACCFGDAFEHAPPEAGLHAAFLIKKGGETQRKRERERERERGEGGEESQVLLHEIKTFDRVNEMLMAPGPPSNSSRNFALSQACEVKAGLGPSAQWKPYGSSTGPLSATCKATER